MVWAAIEFSVGDWGCAVVPMISPGVHCCWIGLSDCGRTVVVTVSLSVDRGWYIGLGGRSDSDVATVSAVGSKSLMGTLTVCQWQLKREWQRWRVATMPEKGRRRVAQPLCRGKKTCRTSIWEVSRTNLIILIIIYDCICMNHENITKYIIIYHNMTLFGANMQICKYAIMIL